MQLRLKIKDIPEHGEHLEVPFAGPLLADALDGTDGDVAASHVAAHLDISRAGETISVRGKLDGDIKLPCTRCLSEAHVPVAIPLRAVVGPESMGAEESLDDEIEYFNHDGEVVDLEPVLRETLILAIPMAALCQPECKGLCPVCGGNRNERDCGCDTKVVDPRLAALKDLKKDLKL